MFQKHILQKQNISIYTPTHKHNLNSILNFNIWQHLRNSMSWFKNNTIKSPLFESESSKLKLNYKLLWTRRRWKISLTTKEISYFYSLLVIFKSIFNILFYDQAFCNSTTTNTNSFSRLRNLPLTYFYIICKYHQSSKDGGVLGSTI